MTSLHLNYIFKSPILKYIVILGVRASTYQRGVRGVHDSVPNRNLRRVACSSKVLADTDSLSKEVENTKIDCGIFHIELRVGSLKI